jgi:acetate kinase
MTRSPLLLWLMERTGIAQRDLADALEHRSGLLGLAGSADMREVLSRADAGEPTALLALEVYVHRLCAGVAAMAAALGGLDALVFTGGVGEKSAEIRARTIARLGFLGLAIDGDANIKATGDRDVTGPGAHASVLVLRAREDLEIARQARAVISGPDAAKG